MLPRNDAVRFMLAHAATGFALATAAVAAIAWFDPGGFYGLLGRAAGHPWPLLLLWFFLGLTLGSVQMGAAIMLRGRDDAHRDG